MMIEKVGGVRPIPDPVKRYGLIVIGKGPAGVQAAIYAARAKIPVAIFGFDEGSLKLAQKIENFYSVQGSISGLDLHKIGVEQAKRFGVEQINSVVVGLGYSDDGGYYVATPDSKYECSALLLATGSQREKAPVEGVEGFLGRGVSYCAVCDGFFFSGKKVGVLGYTDYTAHEAMELRNITEDVIVFLNGRDGEFSPLSRAFFVDKGVRIIESPIEKILGEEKLTGVQLSDGTEEALDGLFVAYGIASSSDLAQKLGIVLSENGDIVTDIGQKTNIPGVFAAGDCTGAFRQVSIAVGQGAMAAKSIIEYLSDRDKHTIR